MPDRVPINAPGSPVHDLELVLTMAGLRPMAPADGIAVIWTADGVTEGLPDSIRPFALFIPRRKHESSTPERPVYVAELHDSFTRPMPPHCPCCRAELRSVIVEPPHTPEQLRTAARCPACSRRMPIRLSWGIESERLRLALLALCFAAQGRGPFMKRQLAAHAARRTVAEICRKLHIPPELFAGITAAKGGRDE